jgi:hypothetical protein
MPLNQPSELGGGQFARRVPATQLNEPIGVSDEPTIERVDAGGAILLEPFSALVDQRVVDDPHLTGTAAWVPRLLTHCSIVTDSNPTWISQRSISHRNGCVNPPRYGIAPVWCARSTLAA